MPIVHDIDAALDQLRRSFPELTCTQLSVRHAGADDDGIWFVAHPESPHEVQLESPKGMCPILVEGTDSPDRQLARSIEETVALVVARLGLRARTG